MRLIYSLLLCSLIGISYSQNVLESLRWGSQLQNVELFYSDSGEIKDKIRSASGVWSQGTFDYPGYYISAISYVKNGRKFRAYVANDSHIQEYINTGSGWTLGDFYKVGEIADASYYFDTLGTLHIIVYLINSTGDLYQYNFDQSKVGLPGKGWDAGTYLYTLP
jgi:hypothetical protein